LLCNHLRRFKHSPGLTGIPSILAVSGSRGSNEIQLTDLTATFPRIEILPNNEILMVATRCQRFPDGTHEMNAKIFDSSGSLKREFLLGDGIEHVQADVRGNIWVGYFDEGPGSFWPPQSDEISIGIAQPREGSRGYLHLRNQGFAAQGFGFGEVGINIVHLHIDGHVMARVVAQGCDVALNAVGRSRVDYCRGSLRLNPPAEELGKESLGAAGIAASDFKVNYRASGHDGVPFFNLIGWRVARY
jgi:hypothetical protein